MLQGGKLTGFVSYARADITEGRESLEDLTAPLEAEINRRLGDNRFEFWHDRQHIEVPDEQYQDAILNADLLIVLLSPAWLANEGCRREYMAFKNRGANLEPPVLPIRLYRTGKSQSRSLTHEQEILQQIDLAHIIDAAGFFQSGIVNRAGIVASIADAAANMLAKLRPRSSWPFGEILYWHLRRGTRPRTNPSLFRRTWSGPEFVRVIDASVSDLRDWLLGRSIPADLTSIEQALFDETSEHSRFVRELRDSWNLGVQPLSRSERELKALDSTNRLAETERLDPRRFLQENLPQPSSDQERDNTILPAADVIPQAETRAIQFTGEADGPIDLASVTMPGEHLQGGPAQREDFLELRSKAAELSQLGQNRLGRASSPIARFLALPEDADKVRAKLFWSRINTLRILWQDHQGASTTQTKDSEPDDRLLEKLVASQLRDLVETINTFVLSDPVLMELDSARPGPQEAEAARDEAATLAPVIEGLVGNPDIATIEARSVIGEQVGNAQNTTDSLAGRQTNDFARRSLRNFVGELLRRAYGPVRALSNAAKDETSAALKGIREGAYRATGAALVTGAATDMVGITEFSGKFIRFVALHTEELSAYVMKAFQNPTLVEIINLIAKFGN